MLSADVNIRDLRIDVTAIPEDVSFVLLVLHKLIVYEFEIHNRRLKLLQWNLMLIWYSLVNTFVNIWVWLVNIVVTLIFLNKTTSRNLLPIEAGMKFDITDLNLCLTCSFQVCSFLSALSWFSYTDLPNWLRSILFGFYCFIILIHFSEYLSSGIKNKCE